ncbi:hypothetical protein HK407_02g02770 [Ordospora pajunii]|uniref:uncharacterized protein n=1 Tax=Ordospora pajunii TaxID=3039483 RepID=UPI0029526F3C|nr:uncharacterized protein HK407_02g02770 [Ordospora pajunii]KAH9412055.1 hypothetical protein HK407_02g02770 [Ordospora pajunii]
MHESNNMVEESSKMIEEAEEEILGIIRSEYLQIFHVVDEVGENAFLRSTELDNALRRIYEEVGDAGVVQSTITRFVHR